MVGVAERATYQGRLSLTASKHQRHRLTMATAIAALTVALVVPVAEAASPKTKRMSISSGGAQTVTGNSLEPTTSATGRFVAFYSDATNLVGNDTNLDRDVFVRDRKKKRTRRISVRTGGGQANGDSFDPSISADGRFVAFASNATNLVGNDDNSAADIFVHDRKKKRTRRVSVKTGGAQANGESFSPSISADGRFVAFASNATNLVGNDDNSDSDVFVHDRKKKRTRRVSIKTGGAESNDGSFSPSISASGRLIAFSSRATNLIGSDGNNQSDVFVHDRRSKKTKRVSVKTGGAEASGGGSVGPAISGDGRFVAFQSNATNLVSDDVAHTDVFVHDRKKKRTKRVSIARGGGQADDQSFSPSISANGRYIGFHSDATDIAKNDLNGVRDAFVHDRKQKRTKRVSVKTGGAEAIGGVSRDVSISGDGRFVAFRSDAENLVGNDNNGLADIFMRGPLR